MLLPILGNSGPGSVDFLGERIPLGRSFTKNELTVINKGKQAIVRNTVRGPK